MLLVFFTLGLIIVALVLLTNLPAPQAKKKQDPSETRSWPPVKVVAAEQDTTDSRTTQIATTDTTDDELARVAAIAVVMLHSRQKIKFRLPGQTTRSAWKHYGRAHQLGL
jgi:hypothetical protein